MVGCVRGSVRWHKWKPVIEIIDKKRNSSSLNFTWVETNTLPDIDSKHQYPLCWATYPINTEGKALVQVYDYSKVSDEGNKDNKIFWDKHYQVLFKTKVHKGLGSQEF